MKLTDTRKAAIISKRMYTLLYIDKVFARPLILRRPAWASPIAVYTLGRGRQRMWVTSQVRTLKKYGMIEGELPHLCTWYGVEPLHLKRTALGEQTLAEWS